jgi:autotransporter-associated beta strand protein
MFTKLFALVLSIGFVAAMATGALGNPITWGNTATNFETGTSWSGSVAPANDLVTDVARFNSSAATFQPALTASRSIAGLDFALPLAGGWTLSGDYILTNGAGTADSGGCGIRATNTSGTITVRPIGLTLGASQSWTNVNGGTLKVDSNIGEGAPGFTLTKVGAGELTLTGTNTFTGGTTLTGGRLNIDSPMAVGTGTLTINAGTTLGRRLPTGVTVTLTNNNPVVINGNFTFVHSTGGGGGNNTSLNLGTNSVSLGTAAGTSRTIDVNNHNDYILSSLIIGGSITDGTTATSIIKSSRGLLILSGVNTYTGTTTINDGFLQFNSPQAIAGSGANVTVNASGTAAPGYDIDQAFLGRIVSTSAGTVALTVNSATALDFSAGGANLTAASLGALTGKTLTYSGVLTPNGTTYRLGGGGGTLTMSTALTGPRSVTVASPGIVVLPGANSYSGATTVGVAGDGKLIIGHNDALGTTDGTAATGVTLQGNQPFLDMQGSITVTNELLTMTCTHPGVRASLRSISGNNTWAGNIVAPTSIGLIGGNFTASAGAPLTINGNITLTAPSGVFVFTPANSTITINGVISGPVTLSPSGQGTVVLSGSNTYNTVTSTGIAIISVNTLRNAGVPSPLGVNGTINISGGNEQGTLKYTGTGDATDLVINMFGGTTWGSRIEQAGTGLLRFTGNMTAAASASARILTLQGSTAGVGEFAGVISDAGTVGGIGVTKAGTGLWILSGPNTYTKTTTVSGGALRLDHATALPGGIGVTGGTSALTLSGGVLGLGAGDFYRGLGTGASQVQWAAAGGGGFAAYGTNRVVNLGGASAGVTWNSGSFVPSASALILSATNATHTVDFQNPINMLNAFRTVQVDDGAAAKDAVLSGVISGVGGGLTKTGAGTLVLTASNTYGTVATTVSAGTLLVNGSLDVTPITVNSNATLGGTGRVAGTVLVKNGAKLAPGDGVGTLTTGGLTLENNAEILCDISGVNNVDKVVASSLVLGANTVLRLRDAGITKTPEGEFVLIQYSGTDPALGSWSLDVQIPGVLPANVSVYQDTANDRIMLKIIGPPKGTLILFQ